MGKFVTTFMKATLNSDLKQPQGKKKNTQTINFK